jgi:hypothetical protein
MTSKLRIVAVVAVLSVSPALAGMQSVREACKDTVSANDLSEGSYRVSGHVSNQSNSDYTPENCAIASLAGMQSVQEACKDIVAANDLAEGAYRVMGYACNQSNGDYTLANCNMVSRAAEFAQKTAVRELNKCKPALARAGTPIQ